MLARFGASIHAAGRNAAALGAAVERLDGMTGLDASPIEAGLEEAFIYLMTGAQDNFAERAA